MHYDLLIVGTGLFGATIAHQASLAGKTVIMLEKRNHIGGNVYTEEIEGIHVHRYGAHIFHTNSRKVWEFVLGFANFNRYTHSPIASYHGKLYSLPFSMYTFNQIWGVTTPLQAEEKITQQRREARVTQVENLEEQALSLVGVDIYETLIKHYTEKQWGRPCSELPAFIIQRLPVRFTFDNNYFNAAYQGIPKGGYTQMVAKMIQGTDIRLNIDYLLNRKQWDDVADQIVYTGPIDAFFDYQLGELAYRTIRFETEMLDNTNFQGNSVINYTDSETPFTRIIEHKWFDYTGQRKTIISREYSSEWKPGSEPDYPVNDAQNNALYNQYRALAARESKVIFGGRLGTYQYYDMDQVIAEALDTADRIL